MPLRRPGLWRYADEPMGEFWSWRFGTNKKYGFTFSCTEMASAAHVYGKKIVGAESFTACDRERWLDHPALSKTSAIGPSAKASTASSFTATPCSPG